MSQRLHRLHPPRVSGELFEERGVFPVGCKRPGERLLHQGDALEGPVGQLSSELLEPPLRRVQLRGVGRELEEAHVLRMDDFLGAVAWGAVEHYQQMVFGVSLREFAEEYLQASVVHPRQVHAEALPRGGLHRGVEVGPLVGAPHDVGRPEPLGAVAPPVPVDQPESRLVEGQNLQRFVAASALPLDLDGEVFLNACCSFWSASSWRGRPVLSLTLRRLRSWPTPSGWAYSMPWCSLRNSSASEMVAISPRFMASWRSAKASCVTNSWRPRSLTLLFRSSCRPPFL